MLTKRAAFRFVCKKRTITLKTDYEQGEGVLVNISTEGCALESATIDLVTGEKLLLAFTIEQQEEPIEIQARVVRVNNESIGLQFSRIEPETQVIIRQHFAREYRATLAS